jgi:alcohol dehydrogenase
MRAAIYESVRGDIRVQSIPAPACPPDGAVVAVKATGVCRSDWHAWQGHDPVPLPHVPGHEYAGVVSAVGPEVTRWSIGDRVTAPFVLGCGACELCLAGDPQVCPDQSQPGFTDHGSFAEFVAVQAADFNLVALPSRIPFESAAALGCRFGTAFRALTGHAKVQPGETVAIFGCGGVGLSAIMIAAAIGAHVIAVDLNPAALERARQLGARETLLIEDPADPPLVDGAHVTIDAFGSEATLRACIGSLRRRGRHVQVGLLFGADAQPRVPMDRVLAWELEVYGSHGIAARDYAELLSFVDAGSIELSGLVERTITLDEAGDALRKMSSGSGPGITVIDIGAAERLQQQGHGLLDGQHGARERCRILQTGHQRMKKTSHNVLIRLVLVSLSLSRHRYLGERTRIGYSGRARAQLIDERHQCRAHVVQAREVGSLRSLIEADLGARPGDHRSRNVR